MINPFSTPVYVMPKPVGSTCNMACAYCYYLEKKRYYPDARRQMMSEATLEEFVKQYIAAQTTPDVIFTWHGGEATVRKLDFYRRVLEMQKKYGAGRNITNCLQTNATLLTDEWCLFLKRNNWLVGVSIDGPEDFHDEYRRMADGRPSFGAVMRGIRMLQRHGVEWNALAVVNDYNADYPVEFYRFFKELGCRFIQFTPVVERMKPDDMLADVAAGGELTGFSVTPRQWGDFLIGVFDEWVKEDVGRVFVQIFDATLANWVGAMPGLCTLSSMCGHAAAMEWNGDVYACDHFVFPQYRLGNIHENTLIEMMASDRQLEFGAGKLGSLPKQCRDCRWLFACKGECPRNRFATTAEGEPGLNYLCEGYRAFFNHVAPYMDFMKGELEAGRAPANVNGMRFD
ncbi:anaerobic sulfatase-maturation protein [Paramuribaculum intestinale]|uniref:anaerobic sulfatase-maturation protein n=2 Tax=Paramuribaculum intestinale TaxID=2094151 RepID=UPI0025A96F1E|nr:anaerobic sulfatase-maturation protein [Paramuribaculum intestinale]